MWADNFQEHESSSSQDLILDNEHIVTKDIQEDLRAFEHNDLMKTKIPPELINTTLDPKYKNTPLAVIKRGTQYFVRLTDNGRERQWDNGAWFSDKVNGWSLGTPTVFDDLFDAKGNKVYDSFSAFLPPHSWYLDYMSFGNNNSYPNMDLLWWAMITHDPFFQKFVAWHHVYRKFLRKDDNFVPLKWEDITSHHIISEYIRQRAAKMPNVVVNQNLWKDTEFWQSPLLAVSVDPKQQHTFSIDTNPSFKYLADRGLTVPPWRHPPLGKIKFQLGDLRTWYTPGTPDRNDSWDTLPYGTSKTHMVDTPKRALMDPTSPNPTLIIQNNSDRPTILNSISMYYRGKTPDGDLYRHLLVLHYLCFQQKNKNELARHQLRTIDSEPFYSAIQDARAQKKWKRPDMNKAAEVTNMINDLTRSEIQRAYEATFSLLTKDLSPDH